MESRGGEGGRGGGRAGDRVWLHGGVRLFELLPVSPKSKVEGRRSKVEGRILLFLGPWTLDLGPWTLDLGPWTLDLGPWTLLPLEQHFVQLLAERFAVGNGVAEVGFAQDRQHR